MIKNKHNYTEELENFLMFLTEDELMEWFESNTIEYDKPLIQVILDETRSQ